MEPAHLAPRARPWPGACFVGMLDVGEKEAYVGDHWGYSWAINGDTVVT